MGIFNSLGKTKANDKKSDKKMPGELEKVREQLVKGMDSGGKNKEISAVQKTDKTLFPGTSDNTSQNDNVEMNIIRILNEIANIKQEMGKSGEKMTGEISSLKEQINAVSELLRNIPQETITEIRGAKTTDPGIYKEIQELAARRIKTTLTDVIDANILNAIKESGNIDSNDLLVKVKQKHICSKNTLFVHLKRLEEKGLVMRKRSEHKVFYSLPDSIKIPEVKDVKKEESKKVEPQPQQSQQPAQKPEESKTDTKIQKK